MPFKGPAKDPGGRQRFEEPPFRVNAGNRVTPGHDEYRTFSLIFVEKYDIYLISLF
jgi:hypothetical protein